MYKRIALGLLLVAFSKLQAMNHRYVYDVKDSVEELHERMASGVIIDIKKLVIYCQGTNRSREQTIALLKKFYGVDLVDNIDKLALALEGKHSRCSCCRITGAIALFLTGGLVGTVWVVNGMPMPFCTIM